jgi:hypothetical protein
MAATITQQGASIGKGRLSPLHLRGGARATKMAVYQVTMDNAYPSGGEDISAIWTDFGEVLGIFVTSTTIATADADNFIVDLTNKKLIALDGAAEAGAVDLSTFIVQLLVIG